MRTITVHPLPPSESDEAFRGQTLRCPTTSDLVNRPARCCMEDNARNGRNEGWIGVLGTRRGFRRMGLGRAILLAGMHRLKAAGMDTAKLLVDAENPLGAGRLYESVGFRKIHTQIVFVKHVSS